MNTWNESVRLAARLLQRLRDFNERGVKAYFTRECLKHGFDNWHFDKKAMRCLRAWYIRAVIAVAGILHPMVRAYGRRVVESIIDELDITKIDVRENLLRDLGSLVYEAIINYATDNAKSNAVASNDAAVSRIINQGIGDLLAQISRVEAMLRNCKGDTVNLEGEELSCEDLWMYDAYLHQTLETLEKLAKKYNISIEQSRVPWWLYE